MEPQMNTDGNRSKNQSLIRAHLCSCVVSLCFLGAVGLLWAVGSEEIPFRKHVIDLGRSETCAVADVNGDGKLDIISGENWFEAPGWTRHKFRSLPFWSNYIDNFSDLAIDVNGDGYPDVVSVAWNARRIGWWENPRGQSGEWQMHPIDSGFPVEFAFLVDLDNDGRARELLPQFGDLKAPLAWYEIRNGAWVKHQVSDHSYGHGIGAGDVNGDGRTDIITPKGWFEAPADPRQGAWTFHDEFDLGSTGFIYVLDVNRDGLPDLVTSLAHDYGIFWMEQKRTSGGRQWVKHLIDDAWSQAHAMTLADLNGDGRPEIVTGKRLYAHNGHDPGERESLGVYWYEYVQNGDHWDWIRHLIDYGGRTGGGMQIPVLDLDGDGNLDVVVAGKSGLYLFQNLTKIRQR
jgi:hypothetical protein